MSKGIFLTLIITLLFVVLLGAFQYLHMTADLEPAKVDSKYTAPINATLDTSFIEEIKEHDTPFYSEDLGY